MTTTTEPAMTAATAGATDRLWREHSRGDHRERDRGPQPECVHCVGATSTCP